MRAVGRHPSSRAVRRTLAAAVAAASLAASSAAAAAARAAPATVRRMTYDVPVTEPGEFGEPVSLATDVYLPVGRPPVGGWPLVELFHGGGSDKDNPYDAGHARLFAEHGYAALLYTARGHAGSGGQTTVAGPKEIRDLFDVTAWAAGLGGRDRPAHPPFHLDLARIALTGYSQGGLHTNLGQAWADDRRENPYGIRFAALEPGNTPDYVRDALIPHGVVKLSFGVALLAIYYSGTKGHVAPLVDRWIAQAALDRPELSGAALCSTTGHDTSSSSLSSDLAWRSVGCRIGRIREVPWLWAQAFDDTLFPADMAIAAWRRSGPRNHVLYLDMGGHAAPASPDTVERDKFALQLAWLDHVLRSRPWSRPAVVYWTRDPSVRVPASSYAYPAAAWRRHTSSTWPPPGTHPVRFQLGAGGRAVRSGARPATLRLAALAEDERHDAVAAAAAAGTPIGTTPAQQLPAVNGPGVVARFQTAAFARDTELDGAPAATLSWTPAGVDTQLVVQVFDVAPDGTLTLLSRGVTGVRAATPGVPRSVTVSGTTTSATVHRGHRLLTWVACGDLAVYEPSAGGAGGALAAGPSSTVTFPLRAGGGR